MSIKQVSFNNFSFQSNGFVTKDIIYRNLPTKVLDMQPYSRRDGFLLVNSYYSAKNISISGTVTADTEANLRVIVDSLKNKLNSDEGNLDITDGSGTVRWIATVSRIEIPEQHYHITRLPFDVSFTCQPFGRATSTLTSTASIVDTSSGVSSVVVVGSAAPRPVIRWTVSGSPSTTITAVSLTNSTTGDLISVAGLTLSGNGDYLEIDTDGMNVVQNTGSGEAELDFTGVFPKFTTSTNSVSVSLVGGGASKTLNQVITYNAAYL